MDRLTEIRTRIEDYQNFDDSLQEIAEALEINTGTYMQLHEMYVEDSAEIESYYRMKWQYDYDWLKSNPDVLANILLAIFVRAHAKIGEISLFLESDIESYEEEEDKILHDMEESQTSDKTKLDIINIPFPEVEANKETIEEYSKKLTPCDYPDNDGHYSCPFDANGGDDCRNFCGLGVDE